MKVNDAIIKIHKIDDTIRWFNVNLPEEKYELLEDENGIYLDAICLLKEYRDVILNREVVE